MLACARDQDVEIRFTGKRRRRAPAALPIAPGHTRAREAVDQSRVRAQYTWLGRRGGQDATTCLEGGCVPGDRRATAALNGCHDNRLISRPNIGHISPAPRLGRYARGVAGLPE